uniref:Secreted protein n=1 Tax=Heterorhabditis bacteriophora TaxID=37862 RepID=A0A1I7WMM6_HETBA
MSSLTPIAFLFSMFHNRFLRILGCTVRSSICTWYGRAFPIAIHPTCVHVSGYSYHDHSYIYYIS